MAGYDLIVGLAGRSAALEGARYGRRPLLAAVGVLPIIAYFGLASFLGWGGIVFGTLVQVSWGLGQVFFLDARNEKIPSSFRATVISMADLGIRTSFSLLGPLVGYGIDAWGLPSVLWARNPVLDRLRIPAPVAGPAGKALSPADWLRETLSCDPPVIAPRRFRPVLPRDHVVKMADFAKETEWEDFATGEMDEWRKKPLTKLVRPAIC